MTDRRSFRHEVEVSLTPKRLPWFQDLVALTLRGPDEDRIFGIVQARVPDDGGTEFAYRVWRRGSLMRCTSLDNRVFCIVGSEWCWEMDRYGALVRCAIRDASPHPTPDDYEFGTSRPRPERWEGDDFTTPTGPAREIEFLGRSAWEIELAPPPRKPHPMQMVIDRQTGLILREANAAFGTFHEWAQLDTDPDLPDHLFVLTDDDRPGTPYIS